MSLVEFQDQKPDVNAIIALLATHPDTHRVLRSQITCPESAKAFVMHLCLALEMNKQGDKTPQQLYTELKDTLQNKETRRKLIAYFVQH